ncbi:golgin subfamily A member 6-like protein 2 [Rhopilema esculentum]|uniref:golgin subfamily A member 6-like protein 2 n=1 Tax=Rhopilema esculentum TaxID=499914 RepID=UPI0031D6A408
MTWTKDHDVLLCREILAEEPYQNKHGSKERGKCWDKIADALNGVERPKFNVDQRAVRDRFVKLERGFRRRINEEMRASGVAPEPSELDEAMEDILERKDSAEQQQAKCDDGKRQATGAEKEMAQAVRKRAMESLSETKARECSKRKKGGETSEYVGYLREKRESNMKLRESEVNLERKKVEIKERKLDQETELRKRELELRVREIEVKEKSQELKAREHEQFEEKFKVYKEHQKMMNAQIACIKNKLTIIEEQNLTILKILERFEK